VTQSRSTIIATALPPLRRNAASPRFTTSVSPNRHGTVLGPQFDFRVAQFHCDPSTAHAAPRVTVSSFLLSCGKM
jgi:hypothetical protein